MQEGRAWSASREAALAVVVATLVSVLLLWLAPPGTDLAAHVYQRAFFLHHGFALWNNFWYAGRYSFVTYSVLYYPLAAVLGINALAVASIAVAAFAFALVVVSQWGASARLSSRGFAAVWPGIILTASFPFALGLALALCAVSALQRRRRLLFSLLAVASAAASPLAFVFLVVLLAGLAIARRRHDLHFGAPAVVVVAAAAAEVLLFRLFPGGGRYPFDLFNLVMAVGFCLLGLAITWRVERARPLAGIFVAYGLACIGSYVVPSELGGNIARLRYAAVPIALLAVSLRGRRSLRLAVPLLAVAFVWNGSLVANAERAGEDPASRPEFWRPAITFLRGHLGPSYRVEAVDTAGHWPAVYLADAGVPLVRGWYRQDDFPENAILYDDFGARAYRGWLRRLGVRYVVLARAPSDYSAQAEQALLERGRSGLTVALRTANLTIFQVPAARPVATGPAAARILRLEATRMLLRVGAPGRYRVAVRYSPYWLATRGCVSRGRDGMLAVTLPRAGVVGISFKVGAERALETLAGSASPRCTP